MTTATFSRHASAYAQVINTVRAAHCPPPSYRPAETVKGSTRCPRCGGTVSYQVSATGTTNGHCTSSGCLRWTE